VTSVQQTGRHHPAWLNGQINLALFDPATEAQARLATPDRLLRPPKIGHQILDLLRGKVQTRHRGMWI
jgi:hypothetical protein